MFKTRKLGRFTVAALGALIVGLVSSPAAGAAWSDGFISPSSLTTSVQEPPDLAVDADGDSYYVWTRSDNVVQGRVRSADGRLEKTLNLSKTGLNVPEILGTAVAANRRGDSLFVWLTMNATSTQFVIQGRARAADGTLGPVQTFATVDKIGGEIVDVDVAIDGGGDGVAMWYRETGNDGAQVKARHRFADGTLGRPKTISAPGIDSEVFDPEVEMDSGGEAVFVWQQDNPIVEGKIQARVLSPTGTLGQTRTLASADAMLGGDEGEGEFSQLAVNPRGDAAFVWAHNIITTGKDVIEGRVLTDDDVLKKTVRLSPSDTEVTEPEVDMANDGAAAFSWGQKDLTSGKFRFTGRALSATNSLGQVKALSGNANDVFHGNVGVDSDGDALFVWEDKDPTTGMPVIKSRTLTSAGKLRSTTNVTALDSAAEGLDLAVAPAADTDAVAAWLNGSVHRVQAAYGP